MPFSCSKGDGRLTTAGKAVQHWPYGVLPAVDAALWPVIRIADKDQGVEARAWLSSLSPSASPPFRELDHPSRRYYKAAHDTEGRHLLQAVKGNDTVRNRPA